MTEVPKRMNFFWGNEKMSYLRYMTLFSFRKWNPDWPATLYLSHSSIKTKTWSSLEKQDFFSYEGADWLDKVADLGIEIKEWVFPNKDKMGPSQQSNFFKWNLLATEGGFYSDLDIVYIKSLDSFYSKIKNEAAGLTHNRIHFSIGFLFSKAESAIFEAIYNAATSNFKLNEYQSAGVLSIDAYLESKGKGAWDLLQDKFPTLALYNIEMPLFYPIPFNQPKKIFETSITLPSETLGLHWFAGTPMAQKYNNLLTPDTLEKYKNTTIYEAIKESL